MLKKFNVFMGLQDDVNDLKASRTEFITVYGMYIAVIVVSIFIVSTVN